MTRGISFEPRGSSHSELRYEVTVPYHQPLHKITRLITHLSGENGTSVESEIKKYETVVS
jgi:hypothetical protein